MRKLVEKNGLGSDQHSKIENVVYLSFFPVFQM